jgi:hypothetical protein
MNMRKFSAIMILETSKAIDALRRRAQLFKNDKKQWDRWARELSEKMNGIDACLRQRDYLTRDQAEIVARGLHYNKFECPPLLAEYVKTGKLPEQDVTMRDAIPAIKESKAVLNEVMDQYFQLR